MLPQVLVIILKWNHLLSLFDLHVLARQYDELLQVHADGGALKQHVFNEGLAGFFIIEVLPIKREEGQSYQFFLHFI